MSLFDRFRNALSEPLVPLTEPTPGLDSNAAIPKFDASDKLLNGRRAEALLTDPLLNAVFEAVAGRYRQMWENSPRGDIETQRVAHLSLAALRDVQGALRAHLGNAKIFEADFEAKKRRDASKLPY